MVRSVEVMQSAMVTNPTLDAGFLPVALAIQTAVIVSAKAMISDVMPAGVGGVTWVLVLVADLGRQSGKIRMMAAVGPSRTRRKEFCFSAHVLRTYTKPSGVGMVVIAA